MNPIEQLKEDVRNANKITIISGAGVSTSSGIPDFRSNEGLYKEKPIESLLSRLAFQSNPYTFWSNFKKIFEEKMLAHSYLANESHFFIERLLDKGKDVQVFTQNIDGLYLQVKGLKENENLFELHGNLRTFTCPGCKQVYDIDYVLDGPIPYCADESCEELLDTNVVLFGDVIRHYDEAISQIKESDLLLVMGTSLEVFPTNEFVLVPTEAKKVFINLQDTKFNHFFDYVCLGKTEEVVQHLI